MANDIKEKVEKFLSLANGDPHHSNYSWDHCYLFFRKFRELESSEQKNQIDLACLNLAFYLASWGMYRGSTFVRWKDYKIYKGVVETLLKPEFNDLWDPMYYDALLSGENEINENSYKIEKVFELKNDLIQSLELHRQITRLKGLKIVQESKTVTDTLVTKILLGTMGCVPAYDNYFRKGLGAKAIKPRNGFNKRSFVRVLNFCKVDLIEFRKVKIPILRSEYYYPLMKIIDMYFWTVGAEENDKEQKK